MVMRTLLSVIGLTRAGLMTQKYDKHRKLVPYHNTSPINIRKSIHTSMLRRSSRRVITALHKKRCYASSSGPDDGSQDSQHYEQRGRWDQSMGEKLVDFGFEQVRESLKTSRVEEVFRNVAPKYDIMNDVMSGGLHRIWKDQFIAKLRPYPGMHHLDVAGGTGDISARIVDKIKAFPSASTLQSGNSKGNPTSRVVISDINGAMLAEGKVLTPWSGCCCIMVVQRQFFFPSALHKRLCFF